MLASKYKQELTNAILELLWKQWTLLGVSGQVSSTRNPYVLDPEALLLFSAEFARFDQRLYDLVIDWLRLNGELVNIPRLKALLKDLTDNIKHSLGFMTSSVNIKKWQCFAKTLLPKKTSNIEELFLSTEGTNNNFIPKEDKTALLYGFKRNQYIPGNKVVPFENNNPAPLLLRLRGAFGLSARAEAILAMLNKEFCRIQDVADCGKYTWKTASDALEELAISGIVVTLDSTKRGRSYFLKNANAITSLFAIKKVIFPDWWAIFNTFSKIYLIVNNPLLDNVSEETAQNELQTVFSKEANEHLHFCGITTLAKLTPDTITKMPQIIRALN